MPPPVDVLVGVHVHAQPRGLSATLASLRVRRGPPVRLVLLPDGPDPPTRAAPSMIDIPKAGPAEALGPPACFNRLARWEDADVIVLLESGCTAGPGWLDVGLPEQELARRLAALVPCEPRFSQGAYARYAAEVGSASQGAVLVAPQLVAQGR